MADEQNAETMDLGQLRELAAQEMLGEPKTEAAVEQPRDEQGRFTSTENSEPTVDESEQTQTEPETETVFYREIDLGDGSGVQRFEAPTMEELVDKLATAQMNATRKIRELSAATKAAPKQEEGVTPEEKFRLAQLMIEDPIKGFEEMYERRRAKEQREEAEANRHAQEFLAQNPDYVPTDNNAHRIDRYLKTYKLSPTVENFSTAYRDLATSGLLETSAPKAQVEAGTEEESRIARPVGTPRKVASGISTKRSIPVAKSQGPSEEELQNMPLDKLRALAEQELMRKA